MRKRILTLAILTFFTSFSIFSQKIIVEGYTYEENDRGFLNEVKVVVLDKYSRAIRAEAFSNMDGKFTVELDANSDYTIQASKKIFKRHEQDFTTKGAQVGKKIFLKVEMKRKPGYLFDVTMAEKRYKEEVVDAVQYSKIEVYNNTKKKETLVLKDFPHPNFEVTFEQGNHYTVMIRKKGFFTKRMEAYVNVAGCILCFDGVGDVRPGVSDVMTKNNTMGTLLANVELERVEMNKSIKLENIYYDLGEYKIRDDAKEELDKLLVTLKDNPSIIVELGSHTDCRGRDDQNMKLSQQRSEAAVNYLVEGGINVNRIKAKGYGETVLVNECANGVRCSERRHQLNRRTELKIIGFLDEDPYSKLSLKEIIEEENFQKMLEEVQNQEVIQVKEGEELPEEIKNKIKKEKPGASKIPAAKKDLPKSKPSTNKVIKKETEQIVEKVRTKKEETVSKTNSQETESILVGTKPGLQTGKVVSSNDLEKMLDKNSAKTSTPKVNVDMVEAKVKKLSNSYSGFRVEVLVSNSKLPASHEIFLRYGNLTLEETKEGTFAYLLGDFEEKKDANSFLKNIIAPRYPKSKVVRYLKGRRILK